PLLPPPLFFPTRRSSDQDTAKLGNPEFISAVKFERPTDAAKKLLPELAQQKPDIKIALTHMGYYHDAKFGSNAPGDVSMVRELPDRKSTRLNSSHVSSSY